MNFPMGNVGKIHGNQSPPSSHGHGHGNGMISTDVLGCLGMVQAKLHARHMAGHPATFHMACRTLLETSHQVLSALPPVNLRQTNPYHCSLVWFCCPPKNTENRTKLDSAVIMRNFHKFSIYFQLGT